MASSARQPDASHVYIWVRSQASVVALAGKESACNAENTRGMDSIPGSGRRKWQPTPGSLRGKSHGQRSLAGYSPWDCKESDMTEQLITSLQQP